MIGYRGAIYRPKDKEVEVLTWSETGERISTFVHYEPYFYVENSFGEEKTIFGTRCTKKSFASNFAKKEWLQKTGIKRIFDSYPATQHVLLNTYKDHNEDTDFSKFPLRICYLDIEAVGSGPYAKPEDPFHPINLITVYDSLEKKYHSWGLEEYTPKDSDVHYRYFKTENALLEAFLSHMEHIRYDLVSGWNCLPLTENIWMKDRISQLRDLEHRKDLYLDDSVLKFKKTGIKKLYKITTTIGCEITSSIDHIFSVYKKNKNVYRNKNTLLKECIDIKVEDMISLMGTDDLYIRTEKNKKNRPNLTYRKYITENIDNILKNGFDLILFSEKLREDLLKKHDFMQTIPYREAFYTNDCYKRTPSLWKYSNLIKYFSQEELLAYINLQNSIYVFTKTVNWNLCIELDSEIEGDYLQLLGMIFTDGTFNGRGTFCIYNSKKDVIDSYSNIIAKLLGHEVAPPIMNKDKCYRKRIEKNNKIGLLMNLIYDTNYKKVLNVEFLSMLSNKQFLKFYSGMFDGDGFVSYSAVAICHYDNLENMKTLQNLLFWNGVVSSNLTVKGKYKNGINNSVRNIKSNKKFIRDVYDNSFNSERRERILKIRESNETVSSNKIIKHFEYEDFILSKVKKIEYMECSVEMADIETHTHYFYCNGSKVHNCSGYDIPYIVNRITRQMGEGEANRLSPSGYLYKIPKKDDFGNHFEVQKISGLEIIDYLEAYKKFSPNKRESYKLDYIGEVEVGQNKTDYGDRSLYQLMCDDWEMFVDYNIQDVKLIALLEQRLKYIELVRMLAYIGCSTFETALQTVGVVTGAMGIFTNKRKQKLCTFIRGDRVEDFEGGFVAVPNVGHHKNIITFDANSLYPNVMLTCNMSNETKYGKIVSSNDKIVTIRHVGGKDLEVAKKDLIGFMKREKLALSRANVLFSQKRKGVAAEVVDTYYQKRVDTRAELKQAKKEYEKNKTDELSLKITYLDTKQQAIKIFLNSLYGAYSNKFCPVGDLDIAESVTLTGQGAIKHARKLVKQFISKETSITDDSKLENCLIFGDTDSIGISMSLLFPNGIAQDNTIKDEAYAMADKLENYLNSGMQTWAEKYLNSLDSRFKFKRELMCDSALFLAKKRYVFHILDKEGFKVNTWKYTGIELVRTTMPKKVKPYVEKIIHNLVLTKDQHSTNQILTESYDIFNTLPIENISLVSGVNTYMKYASRCDGLNTPKGMPCAVKAAYFYNYIIKQLNLTEKYEEIRTGDKIKYFFVQKPNRYGIDAIAYKYKYPEEFDKIFKPDTEKMFEKDMYKCIERFYEAMGWNPRKPNQMLFSDLEQLFG